MIETDRDTITASSTIQTRPIKPKSFQFITTRLKRSLGFLFQTTNSLIRLAAQENHKVQAGSWSVNCLSPHICLFVVSFKVFSDSEWVLPPYIRPTHTGTSLKVKPPFGG